MLVDQFSALSLQDQVATIKAFRAIVKETREAKKAFLAKAKIFKENQKAERAAAKAERQAAAIAKAQARLQKLLDKQAAPVGVKALKANRKPSKATVTYGAEANAIAAAIMAKKASA